MPYLGQIMTLSHAWQCHTWVVRRGGGSLDDRALGVRIVRPLASVLLEGGVVLLDEVILHRSGGGLVGIVVLLLLWVGVLCSHP